MTTSSTTWTRLGKNPLGEWVEENSSGQRRVVLSGGVLMEPPQPSMRWCRLASSADALVVAKSLAHPHVFKSYGSLARACAVWVAKMGEPTGVCNDIKPLQKLVEQAMAKRVWAAVLSDRWLIDLPLWDEAVKRPGARAWPLGIDLGIMRRWYRQHSWDQYLAALKKDLSSGALSIQNISDIEQKNSHPNRLNSYMVFSSAQKTSWFIAHHQKPSESSPVNSDRLTLTQWSGPQPELAKHDQWSSDYIAFSRDDHEVSGFVDPLLGQAQNQARPLKSPDSVRSELAFLLGKNLNELSDLLSYDQMDAVFLAHDRLVQKKGFLLADETGYGKGRVLAALAKIALNKNIQVVFFTEKKSLFSDFFRDCLAVMGEGQIPDPFLLHNTASVADPDGRAVYGSKQRKDIGASPWVWTTYSQFNRGVKTTKMTQLLEWMRRKPTWVILDESQNASGQSNTADVIREIEKSSSGVVFSSATFSKNEEHLAAYQMLFDGSSQLWGRLQSAFASHSDLLRTAITLQWAGSGCFLRREHPPIDPPLPIWISASQKIIAEQDAFAVWWRKMLECAKVWSKISRKDEGPWVKIGAPLARAVREFSLLQKTQDLQNRIEASLQNNQKCVIVSDWTLSSHLRRLVNPLASPDNDEDGDEEDTGSIVLDDCPTWKKSWMSVITTDLFSDDELNKVSGLLHQQLKSAREACLMALSALPDWSASPFDDLRAWGAGKNIRIGEVSGRQLSLQKNVTDGQEKWVVAPRKDDARNAVVRQFNQGDLDVVLLTRAGNSGLSLHAGALFKDQRQRHLIEWDVSPDPSVRLQFWGRVRRKDQVNEPERSVLLIDTPSERRRIHRDLIKQQKLSSHSGKKSARQNSWVGEDGRFVARQWAEFFPDLGASIGAFFDPDVEKVLARAVIFQEKDKSTLMSFVERGVDLLSSWRQHHLPSFDQPSFSLREHWWWGDQVGRCVWRERVWKDRPSATALDVFSALKDHAQQKKSQSAPELIAQWKTSWSKWFSASPQSKTSSRERLFAHWNQIITQIDRGQGVLLTDPITGDRTRGVVLGFDVPDDLLPEQYHPSQIGLWVWPCSSDHPLLLSLSAWFSPLYGAMTPCKTPPSPHWFSQSDRAVYAMSLEGDAWSVAAWGARNAPQGSLIHIQDEEKGWVWGWKMPQWWSWDHMLSSDRELANIDHFLRFCKEHQQGQASWRWSPQIFINVQVQPGGLLCSGDANSLEKINFAMIQKLGSPRPSGDRSGWVWTIPWKNVRQIVHAWSSSGAAAFVSSQHASWHQKTFPKMG